MINNALHKLCKYVEVESFKGYDPYDILNSNINFNLLGKWGPPVATQIHKRNPVNLRRFLGIKKDFNPKGLGVFLKAYCNLYEVTKESRYLDKANWLFNWLSTNHSKGYSGYCWGYNFPWASSEEYNPVFMPSVVVTSVVIDAIYTYYVLTKSEKAREIIQSSADYVLNDIPVTRYDAGHSFAYTHKSKGSCYNASLHAAEILARAKSTGKVFDQNLIEDAVMYVIHQQKQDGSWYYSYNPAKDTERKQIDFHQGFILVSLYNIGLHVNLSRQKEVNRAVTKGLRFYWKRQFTSNGRSFWRLPRKYPVDIHNQSQGVITFAIYSQWDKSYLVRAETILDWTIEHMQDKSGYFYYRIHPWFIDKTPYIRWGQAWMLLAFSEYLKSLPASLGSRAGSAAIYEANPKAGNNDA